VTTDDNPSVYPSGNFDDERLLYQATGVLMIRRRTCSAEALAYLVFTAAAMGMEACDLSALIVAAVNKRSRP
jgi:hypothetical protein